MDYTSIRIATSDRDYVKDIAADAGISIAEQLHRLIRAERLDRARAEAARLDAIATDTGFATQWDADCDALESGR